MTGPATSLIDHTKTLFRKFVNYHTIINKRP